MRVITIAKVALLTGALSLSVGLSAASAKTMKLPPGACAFEKTAIASGTFCSYQCNPQTQWCSQQLCTNGTLTQLVPCFSGFCTAKCGG